MLSIVEQSHYVDINIPRECGRELNLPYQHRYPSTCNCYEQNLGKNFLFLFLQLI